jgi:hypothetical protein
MNQFSIDRRTGVLLGKFVGAVTIDRPDDSRIRRPSATCEAVAGCRVPSQEGRSLPRSMLGWLCQKEESAGGSAGGAAR